MTAISKGCIQPFLSRFYLEKIQNFFYTDRNMHPSGSPALSDYFFNGLRILFPDSALYTFLYNFLGGCLYNALAVYVVFPDFPYILLCLFYFCPDKNRKIIPRYPLKIFSSAPHISCLVPGTRTSFAYVFPFWFNFNINRTCSFFDTK